MNTRSGTSGVSVGDLVSGLGAAVLLASLWRPWYDLRIPGELLDQARQLSSGFGVLAPYAQQGIDEFQARGSLPVTAWQIFGQLDVALAMAAGAVLGLVLLNVIGALSARLDGIVAIIGLVCAVLVTYRLAVPPGREMPATSDLLHPAGGIYAALVGALRVCGGAVMAATRGQASPVASPPPSPPHAAHQIKVWDAS